MAKTTTKKKPAPLFHARLVADLHFNEWPEYSQVDPETGINSRLLSQLRCMKTIMEDEGENGRPDTLIVAGDVIHKHGTMTPAIQFVVKKFFDDALMLYKKIMIVPGNHDYELKTPGGWLHALTNYQRGCVVEVFDEGKVSEINPGLSIGFVPWMRDHRAFKAEVKKVADKGATILVSHIAVAGFKTDNGWTMEGGIGRGDLLPDKFEAVFLGDFHTRQCIGNVYYIGAPYQMNWNDSGDDARGALDLMVDHEGNLVVTDVESPAPKFVRVSSMDEAKAERAKGNYVKLSSSKVSAITAAASEGISFEILPPPVPKQRLNVDPDSSAMDVLDKYLETVTPEEAELDKDLLRQVCSEVVGYVDTFVLQKADAAAHFEILEVEAQNFLSYGRLTPLSLDNRGVVLLEGLNDDDPDAESNGSGKSSIVEVIYYAHEGKCLRDQPVGEIQKTGSKGGMFVRVQARVRTGQVIDIWRCRKVEGKPDGLSVYLKGKPLKLGNDPQKTLRQMTGLTPALFKQVMIFGQEVNSVFAAATDAEKKSLLENLCSGGQFEPLYAQAQLQLRECEDTIRDVEASIKSLQASKERVEGYLETEAELESVYEAKCKEQADRELDAAKLFDEKAAEAEKSLKVEKKELELLKGALDSLAPESDGDELSRDIMDAAKDLTRLESDLRHKQNTIDCAEGELATINLEAGTPCPTCSQKVTGKTIKGLEAQFREDIARYTAEADAIKKEMVEFNTRLKQLQERKVKFVEAQTKFRDTEGAITYTQTKVDSLERQLTTARSDAKGARDKAERLMHPDSNPHTASVARFTNELEGLEKQIQQKTVQQGEVLGLLPYFKECSRLFGNQGLKTFLFDSLAPRITQLANEALQVLSSGSLSVELSTTRTKAGEKIAFKVSNALGATSYKGNSGGQKRKVDLAICWAISQLVESKVNVLLIDEGFDGLDSLAGERVAQLLQLRVDTRGTIIVITHRSEFRDSFQNIWTVTKKDGESILREL